MSSARRLFARLAFLPTLAWNVLLGRVLGVRNWWDAIDDQVILGARPFPSDVKKLAALGVRGVVNTCEEYQGPLQEYREAKIEQLYIPTTDFTPPSLDDLERAVEFMDQRIARGEKVYVHCKAGRARSATVVMCWLIAKRGLSPNDAQALLLQKRPHVHRRLAERTVVQEFARRYGQA